MNGTAKYRLGASFPVKGREIDASILFADISNFSARTLPLSSTETLVFVNDFFTWITPPLISRLGIVDKYIGDEVMAVFSAEFGSPDPFAHALQAARWMVENDVRAYCPHIGIASGPVTVGYVGTSVDFNCSVFGTPVTLAARCAGDKTFNAGSTRVVFPAAEWRYSTLEDVFPDAKDDLDDSEEEEEDIGWTLHEPRMAQLKNIGQVELRCIEPTLARLPTPNASPEVRAYPVPVD